MNTRISSIFDIGATGMYVGTEMAIGATTAFELRSALSKSINKRKGKVKIILSSGHPKKGNCVFFIRMFKEDGEETNITYEFKTQGSNTFLNVTCNPTVLMVGDNTLPVMLEGKTLLDTFKLMNRLPYQMLEVMLRKKGFTWKGEDKQKLVDGNISLIQMQVAFYSGDLGMDRDTVLDYLKTIYGGHDATSDQGVHGLARGLGLEYTLKDEGNMYLVSRSGKHREFSLCLYQKDKISTSVNSNKVRKLIRFDCTLYSHFLANKKVKTLKALEEKYAELCTNNSDSEFVIWLRKVIMSKVKLPYIVKLDRLTYFNHVAQAAEIFVNNDSAMAKVFNHWYKLRPFKSQAELAALLEIDASSVNRAQKKLLREYGIDITISRSYISAMFDNRANANRTFEEREVAASFKRGDNRRLVETSELHERAEKQLEKVRSSLQKGGLLSVRKFKPVIVDYRKLHIYKQLGVVNPEVTWEFENV